MTSNLALFAFVRPLPLFGTTPVFFIPITSTDFGLHCGFLANQLSMQQSYILYVQYWILSDWITFYFTGSWSITIHIIHISFSLLNCLLNNILIIYIVLQYLATIVSHVILLMSSRAITYLYNRRYKIIILHFIFHVLSISSSPVKGRYNSVIYYVLLVFIVVLFKHTTS